MKKVFLFLIPLFMYQCKKESIQETFNSKISETNIPFETEESLISSGATSLEKDNEIVHYKIMRNLAIKEIIENYTEELKLKGSFTLSEYPIIIYNYDSKPAYYEFIAFQDNEPRATVTTFANKKTDDIVAFLLPFVRDFSSYNENDDFFIGLYPGNPYIGDASNYGQPPSSLYDKARDRNIEPLPVSDIQKLEDLYAMMPDEDKQEIGNGKEEIKQEILQEEEEGRVFWDAKFSEFQNLIDETDVEIMSMSTSGKTNVTIYTTPHYNNNSLKQTYWSVDCGPAVTAWIYRGFYSSYNGSYIRVRGDSQLSPQFVNWTNNRSKWENGSPSSLSNLNTIMGNSDGGLLHRIYDVGNTTWNVGLAGMTWPTGMQKALKDVTNSNYKFNYVTNIHLHIKNHNLPAFRVIGVGGGSLHFICEFATKKVGTKKWFLVTDNGYSMSSQPYWRNNTQAQYGFRYGVRQN